MGADAMSDWEELGMLYAIHNHAHSIKRKQINWRTELDLADRLGAVGARFDARAVEPVEPPAPKVRYSRKTIWEDVAAA